MTLETVETDNPDSFATSDIVFNFIKSDQIRVFEFGHFHFRSFSLFLLFVILESQIFVHKDDLETSFYPAESCC